MINDERASVMLAALAIRRASGRAALHPNAVLQVCATSKLDKKDWVAVGVLWGFWARVGVRTGCMAGRLA